MDAEPPADATAAEPPKKGGLAGKLVLTLVVLLAGAGGGAWWFLGGATEAAEPTAPPLESRGLVPFEPFLVNLADQGGNRFLKLTMQLVVGDAAQAKTISDTPVVLMQLRSTILELLTEQTAGSLVTAEGKGTLKAAVKARVAGHLPDRQVIDVLFSEFVVQF
jgi:flagellar FliL protein